MAWGQPMRNHDRPWQRPSRRSVIVGAGASAIALSAGPAAAQRPAIATGTVFEDGSGKGVRRSGDRGIAGVLVSNGRDVTTTTSDGRWRLPIAPGDSLFVIKPTHWTTPLGEGGVPKFTYLHHPLGTPRERPYRDAGVGPTGVLPTCIDFALQRREEASRFEALLV